MLILTHTMKNIILNIKNYIFFISKEVAACKAKTFLDKHFKTNKNQILNKLDDIKK